MSAIGILGGMGPQASMRLVELLIEGTSKFISNPLDSNYPEIIHLSVPVPNFISNKRNMKEAKQILIQKTKLLEVSGSTINCIACNTAHLLLPELKAVTRVPFLSIPNLVANNVKEEGFQKVGLLATPNTLESTLYDDEVGKSITIVRPNQSLRSLTEQVIRNKLKGTLNEEDRQSFIHQAYDFKDKGELDAVILGCTELPLVLEDVNDRGFISCLQVLADGLLEVYFTNKT